MFKELLNRERRRWTGRWKSTASVRSAAKKKTVGMPEFTKKDEFVKIYVNFSQNSLQKILFGI